MNYTMKPIPGYPGHLYEVSERDGEGKALRVRFARHRGGPLDAQLRKRTGNGADASWLLRYRSGESDVWKAVSPAAPPPWTPDGIVAALRNALDELNAAAAGGDRYATLRATTAQRARLTLGTLAEDWIQLGMPVPDGTPRTTPRQNRLRPFIDAALKYWSERDPGAVGQRQIKDFAAWRRSQATGEESGDRSTDLQLVALSNLCQWAVADERIRSNPFTGRPRFRKSENIRHCPEDMPHDAAELHRLCGHLMADPDSACSGAQLLFQAMTGLRPGEPGALRRQAGMVAGRHQPGARYQVQHAAGPIVTKLAIARSKRGINPAVVIHPDLAEFLAAWDAYVLQRWPSTPWLFPDPDAPEHPLAAFGESKESRLSRDLTAAARALGLPRRRPHAMRAYYVRVRLSQGTGYAQIADELGERTGASIVKSTYAFGDDCVGDGRFGWRCPEGVPAWRHLPAVSDTPQIVSFPGGATENATSGGASQMPSNVITETTFDTQNEGGSVSQAVGA